MQCKSDNGTETNYLITDGHHISRCTIAIPKLIRLGTAAESTARFLARALLIASGRKMTTVCITLLGYPERAQLAMREAIARELHSGGSCRARALLSLATATAIILGGSASASRRGYPPAEVVGRQRRRLLPVLEGRGYLVAAGLKARFPDALAGRVVHGHAALP